MVTIKDVAEKAGVNPSTVSRTLKDSPSISQATKERVRKAMDDLGYVPNLAAQTLASGQTQSIGVILPPLMNQERLSQPFFMQIITAINAEASRLSLTVSIAAGENVTAIQEQVQLMHRQKRADGFILLYAEEGDPVKDYLVNNALPFVMVGAPQDEKEEIPYVDNDNVSLGQAALNYLYQHGHKEIAFVTDDRQGKVFQRRYQGYKEASKHLGLPIFAPVLFDRKNPASLQDFTDLLEGSHISALIVSDDLTAVQIMQWLSFYHLKVPDDYSIISFNNSTYANIIHPYLSSFDIQIEELGKASLHLLIDRLKTKKLPPLYSEVPFLLMERESVLKK